MTLDATGTLALAAAILLAVRFLSAGIAPLARYNIPQPISGGLAVALLAAGLHAWGGLVIESSGALRAPLLLAFFASVGLSADLGRLHKGGPKLLLFLALQNAVGTSLAMLLDQHPLIGLLGGSVTLLGGHGTGAAYARIFEETHSLAGVMGLALLASKTCSRTASAGKPPDSRTPPVMPSAVGVVTAPGMAASRQPDTAPLRATARARKAVGSAVGIEAAVALRALP